MSLVCSFITIIYVVASVICQMIVDITVEALTVRWLSIILLTLYYLHDLQTLVAYNAQPYCQSATIPCLMPAPSTPAALCSVTLY